MRKLGGNSIMPVNAVRSIMEKPARMKELLIHERG
jgi:hypothetical protein